MHVNVRVWLRSIRVAKRKQFTLKHTLRHRRITGEIDEQRVEEQNKTKYA